MGSPEVISHDDPWFMSPSGAARVYVWDSGFACAAAAPAMRDLICMFRYNMTEEDLRHEEERCYQDEQERLREQSQSWLSYGW